MSEVRHYILVGNKRYDYTMVPAQRYTTIVCKGAGIRVRVPIVQVPQVLGELAREILSSREQAAMEAGFDNVSAYLRNKALGEM